MAELLLNSAVIFSVAKLGDRIVGTSLVQCTEPRECSIELLCVDPELQGCGIGNHLLRRAEHDGAQRLGANLSNVEVLDQRAWLTEYYERRGYRKMEGSRPYPHRLRAPAFLLRFAKQLTPR
ncbi:MAG: N-acetyltransferase [Deltaproteobacteria bacterium]|nr:MAG: N-acetyltransferase [Deltaproteobacteria bacterium]